MKKVIAILAAFILCVSMAVSVSAFEGSADIAMYAQNNADWSVVASDPVTVNADGEYTLKLEGLSIAPDTLTVIYIKDTAVVAEETTKSNLPADITILTKSLKINGNEIALTEGYPTTLTDAGALDICWYNIWATSYFSTEGMDTITDVEVTFEVVSAAATSEPAETAETEAPAEEAPADAPDAADDTAEAAPAPADEASEPADTGIVLALAPMAIAACAVIISKKR